MGDFNARTEMEGGKVGLKEGDEEGLERKSIDKKMNKEGKRLIKYIKERRWSINEDIRGYEKGNWIHTENRGESIIEEIREEMVLK